MHLAYCLSVLLLASLGNASAASEDASKYTVAFHFEGLGYRCLGGLISERFVLSVGECFADRWGLYIDVPRVTAVAGAKDLSDTDGGAAKSDVQEVLLPFFFAGRSQRHIHDFAIVKLKESLNLAANGLVALRVPAQDETDFTKVGVVAGYGVNRTSSVSELKYENVMVVDYIDCFQGYPHDDFAGHQQFCIKRERGNCASDRGSPYVSGDVLVGVQMTCVDDSPYELYKKVAGYSYLISKALEGGLSGFNRHVYP